MASNNRIVEQTNTAGDSNSLFDQDPHERQASHERKEAGKLLTTEAFQSPEMQRSIDKQSDRPRATDPAQVYKSVFVELNEAKQNMIAVNELISKGGGPYAQGDGFKSYQIALDSAQQHYSNARLAADTFLYVCDKHGNPVLDRNGNPVPSKENLALRQEQAQMDKEMQKLAQDKSPAGQQRLQQIIEQSHMLSDLLRSSGYARANNALALMFHSGDLQGEDRKNFARTGNALLGMASKFDPAMWGPPPDANFMKHYNQAMDVLMGGAAEQPAQVPRSGDQAQPQTLPPRPGDMPQILPIPDDQSHKPAAADQTKAPIPGDQAQPPIPSEQTQLQGAPIVAEGNQYYLNYRGLHLPTWTEKNPDGTASQPFSGLRNVKQPDGSIKQEQILRADGMLKAVTNAQGKILGTDGAPLIDNNGLRRVGDNGLPVPAQFDATDPSVMQAQLESAINGPMSDQTRAAYNKVIDSADKLDRVSMSRAMEKNEEFIKKNPEAFQWENSYRQLNKQLGDIFNDLGKFRQGLNPAQVDALKKIWGNVTSSQDIDKWINDPANKASKDALTVDPQKWATIKSKYGDYLNKEAEIKAKETELTQKPDLLDRVKKVRAADAMNQELTRLFSSSLETRAGYAARLLDEDSVKNYKTIADKNSPEAKALEADANVKEVKRVLAELIKTSPQLAARLDKTGKSLGLDMEQLAPQLPKPANQTASEPGDQLAPKLDETQTPKPAEKSQKPKPADQQQKALVELSQDQSNAPQALNNIYSNYLKTTETANKPMKAEDFAQIAPAWEKALDANASIKKEQLDAYEEQAQEQYGNQIALSLALQKAGKTSFDQLIPDDLNKVTQDELKTTMTKAVQQWIAVSNDLSKAQQALTPEYKQKYLEAEMKFQTAIDAAQKDAATQKAAGADKAKSDAMLQTAYQTAFTAKLNEQKALNPDLSKAIEARSAFLNDAKGVFAKQYLESLALVDSYKHVDEARIQFAQALSLQAGDDNKAKASKYLIEAMKNPDAARLLESTQDGVKLLKSLNLRTPGMIKAQEEQDKIFPELKLTREAIDLATTNWQQSDAKFKAAEEGLDKELMDRTQEKELTGAMQKLKQTIDSLSLQIGWSLSEFKNQHRYLPDLPNQPTTEKDSSAETIRASMQNMTQLDMLDALLGAKGKQLQENMLRVLTDYEKGPEGPLQNLLLLNQKMTNISQIRLQHAILASDYGFKQNDESAKSEAKSLLEKLRQLDPVSFSQTPNLIGALKQAEQGRQIEVAAGKASSIAFSESAKNIIDREKGGQKGLIDWLIPRASLELNNLSIKATGSYASEIPVLGALFGGNKETTDLLVKQLAESQRTNAEEAKIQHEQFVSSGSSKLGDLAGLSTTFLTGIGLSTVLQKVSPMLPGWAKLPVLGLAAIGTGGLVNNAVSGDELGSSRGYIRNTVLSGTTFAVLKTLSALPVTQEVSLSNYPNLAARLLPQAESTAADNSLRASELLTDLSKITPGRLGQELAVKEGAGFAFGIRPSKLLNLTPFSLSADATMPLWKRYGIDYVGFGGEKALSMLESGTMKLPEFRTRVLAARTLYGAVPAAFTMGALNKSAELYTDNPNETKNKSISEFFDAHKGEMFEAGLQYGMAGAFLGLVPPAGQSVLKSNLQMSSTLWIVPALDKISKYNSAAIYDNYYKQAEQERKNEAAQEYKKTVVNMQADHR